jgi:hypothetical protein
MGDLKEADQTRRSETTRSQDQEPKTHRNRSVCLLIFLFFLCLYVLTFKGISTGDNLLHYDLVLNTVTSGQFSLPVDRYDLDKQRYLKPYVSEGLNGRLYLTLPPGLALASIPTGLIGVALECLRDASEAPRIVAVRRDLAEVRATPSAFITALINPLVSAMIIVVFFWMVSGIAESVEWALLLSIMLGLSTIVWPYSTTYWTQPLATGAVFGSFVLLSRGIETDRLFMGVISGLLAGVGLMTRYEAVFVLPWLILLVLSANLPSSRRRSEFLLGILGPFLVSVAMLMGWNHHRFGSVFEMGAFHQRMLGASFQADLALSLPANLFGLGNSIFVYSPPLILFFFGIGVFLKRKRALAVTTTGIVLTGLVLYSKFTLWDAIGSWGPRFLVVLTPFMLLPAAVIHLNSRWRRALVVSLLSIGFAVQVVPVLVPYQHAAVTGHFADYPSPQRYFTTSEIVPHIRSLAAGGIELWWLRTPVLGVMGMCLILILCWAARRLIRIVFKSA